MSRKNGFRWVWIAALCAFGVTVILAPYTARSQEQTFDVLTIGTRTYNNVTVTTKAKTYVMLMHSEGLANVKVSELSPEMRQTLGYKDLPAEKSKGKAADAAKWAKEKIGSLKIGEVQALEANFKEKWAQRAPGEMPYVGKIDDKVMLGLAGGLVFFWFLFSACLRTICKKAGKEPGFLIWLPLLQIFPMLSAAGMSPLWILGCPLGITQIVWCFMIAKARGKGAFTGLCLLLPITNVFAFLYLTFADGGGSGGSSKPQKENRRVGAMRLGTA